MNEDDLSRWLEAGDPPRDGAEPTPEELAALRHEILATETSRSELRRRWVAWVPATAAAAAALAALLVLAPGGDTARGRGDASLPPEGRIAPLSTEEVDDVRQVQFATEGGTRIIWVLNPDLSL